MNILMFVVLVIGMFCGLHLRRETFPEFDMETILVSVSYPGATPEEVENGICQKIEEALQSLDGVKKITASASEGVGMVTVELKSSVTNVDRILNEVREEVDRIPSFPELAEDPVVQRVKMQETVLSIGILGPEDDSVDSQLALREVAENLRNELLQLSRVSMVNLVGTKNYQIDVEIPESTLRAYDVTLDKAASILRAENVQTPGGTIRAPSQEINVRTDNRRYDGRGIAELPFITRRDGTVIRFGDVAHVQDEFETGTAIARVYTPPETGIPDDLSNLDGRPVIALGILRNTSEDLLALVDQVYDFLDTKKEPGALPDGYSLITWGDRSEEVRGRLRMLVENGIQGLLIVFILLAMFLDFSLAFWVSLGIPFSICAASLFLYGEGITLNMISTFGVIMALGMVVDDAIVIGENIYTHRQRGKDFFNAAVDGTTEVLPSVFSSVLTTVVAFVPLMFVSGIMGKIIFAVPLVMISILCASLCESCTILPCHLAHPKNIFLSALRGYLYIFSWVLWPLGFLRKYMSSGMEWTIQNLYSRAIRWTLANRVAYINICLSLLIFTLALVGSGIVPYEFFPKTDGNEIQVSLSFPNGTPPEVTDQWTRHLQQTFWRVAKKYEEEGTPIAVRSFRVVGTSLQSRGGNMSGSSGGGTGHKGGVQVELVSDGSRTISNFQIANRWREEAGVVPGADDLSFDTQMFGPPGGAIEVMFVAQSEHGDELTESVERCKKFLAEFDGVTDISDDDIPGKWEFRLRVRESAQAMGIHPEDLADVIRAAYYGAEVQRLQRGRHEVKLMVCYPEEDRRSLGDFNEIRLRTPDGDEYPITELADIEVVRGYTTISRRNQMRSITVSADVDSSKANAQKITALMKSDFLPKLKKEYPDVSTLWEGHEEQKSESNQSMIIGFTAALCAMFIILSMQFRSYVQPLIILAIIPFSIIGVVAAHFIAGEPLCQFSLFGLVALSGIVVNDSIVLIDFINTRVRRGEPVHDVLLEAGKSRFRPVVLTSVTTIGGLLPIVLETSLQAQMIIPMALSVAGGATVSLLLVLFFVPVLYSFYADTLKRFHINLHDMLVEADEEAEVTETVEAERPAADAPIPQ